MHIALDPSLLLTDDQGHLAVDLKAGDTVNDVAAGFFKLACPFDIVGLVETGLDLDQCGDLLAVDSRFLQGVDNSRSLVRPIQGHLDRQDVRITRGGLNQVDGGIERLIGHMDHHVVFLDPFKNMIVLNLPRDKAFISQPRQIDMSEQFKQESQIEIALDLGHLILIEMQPLAQHRTQLSAAARLSLQINRLGEGPFLHLVIDGLEDIGRQLLVAFDLTIPDNAKQGILRDPITLEKVRQVCSQNIFDKDEVVLVARGRQA